VVEDLGFARSGRGDEVLFEHVQNVLADFGELSLNLFPIRLDHVDLSLITLGLFLLLDGRDDTPGGAAGTNDILVCDREKVALFDGQLLIRGSDALHVFNHFCGWWGEECGVSGLRVSDQIHH
jgi:hypothetical protein